MNPSHHRGERRITR